MKVAVISAVPTCGKTMLVQALGSVYSRSQGREVAIFTTGDAKDNIELVTNYVGNDALDNPHIFRAMVKNAGESAEDLLDYGLQAGDEHVYIYNILGASMSDADKEEFFLDAIDAVPVDLTLIEIHGDLDSELNAKVLQACDCCLLLTEQSPRGFRLAEKVIKEFKIPTLIHNRALIISKCDPMVASDKSMAQKLKIGIESIYKFPRNSTLAKMAYNGELDRAAYNIVIGDHELAQLRIPLLEIMQFIFDDKVHNRKVIRGVDKWYK